MHFSGENYTSANQLKVIMAYAAQLELEVDRLRRRDQFLQQQCREHLRRLSKIDSPNKADEPEVDKRQRLGKACEDFGEFLKDISEPPGYHPSFDQVVAIAVRPLCEQVFRWQQRLTGASEATLRLDLQPEHIDWFPGRLRHILENLISNALRFRDPTKGEIRVGLELRTCKEGYELRFSDNGVGIPGIQAAGMLELFYRAAPTREAGLGVGLAVVKLIVEQCCGTINVSSVDGQGTSITVMLPRYDLEDYVA
jgi:signal transduction histidine kinase